jgi:hypothetical protein
VKRIYHPLSGRQELPLSILEKGRRRNMPEHDREEAVKCFNATWALIDKPDRTHEDDVNMIHMAHASRYHWGEIGTALEFSRGEWQISRVYSLLHMGESALFHAKEALRLCLDNGIGDFDLAFGYEAMARAYSTLGNHRETETFIEKAKEAAKAVAKQDDRRYVESEISNIK